MFTQIHFARCLTAINIAVRALAVVAIVCAEGMFAHADELRPDYLRDVRPILAANCFACHGPDAGSREGGLRLDQSAAAQQQLESGAYAIVPRSAERSELVLRIESADADTLMPPAETNKSLTVAEKRTLRNWIESGAAYAEHWAFTRPHRSPIPKVARREWIKNEIDVWVLAQLEQAGLAPSPEADKATLVRRASLDLTGLPPTPQDVNAFLRDDRTDAYERLVDRLLMSPHFGEKLAQDWLDIARFGDTSGYQDDNDRPNWPYRDAVIRAFNDNLPFDHFTIESLAGDLLPNPSTSQKVLSGFNRLHRYNEEGGSDPDEFRVVYAIDRTNTTAAAWMGISLGCAQCHDHKYDPLSQKEYYQFLAFFNSLKGEIPVSKGPANPPQIQVVEPEEQLQIDQLNHQIAQIDDQLRKRDNEVEVAFAAWLRKTSVAHAEEQPDKTAGAIGGTIARSSARAYYADAKLAGDLTLKTAIHSSGRVTVAKAVNNDVAVFHFDRSATKGLLGVGWAVAEGPRFFASLGLPDGTVIHSPPIAAELGVEYRWHCRYDPDSGKVVLELEHDAKPIGTTSLLLTADQRRLALTMNAFGIGFRGLNDQDTPLEFWLDEVEYTAAATGETRSQNFDADPQWTGLQNQDGGHQFGYDRFASTRLNRRTEIDRLRQRYLDEHAPDIAKLQGERSLLQQQQDKRKQSAPLALVWEETEVPRPTHLLIRGDYLRLGERVDRDVPAIFPPLSSDSPRNRLTLARWLVSGEHPLTARVAVNRYWKLVFGGGLVRTPEDFGTRGELPTHPELLDELACEFQENGWNVKQLLRKIVTSSTYRQSSVTSRDAYERDPHNRRLARGSRFRLSAEEIRDVALASSGLLNRRIGGRSVFTYQPDHFYRDKEDDPNEWNWPVEKGAELYRRGLYTFIRRTNPYPSFQSFDASGRGECLLVRARTNTPLQALVTLNDPSFVEAARVLAERVLRDAKPTVEDRLALLFRCVLSREPHAAELTILKELHRVELQRYQADPSAAAKVRSTGPTPSAPQLDAAEVAAWTTIASAMLNIDEAITRE